MARRKNQKWLGQSILNFVIAGHEGQQAGPLGHDGIILYLGAILLVHDIQKIVKDFIVMPEEFCEQVDLLHDVYDPIFSFRVKEGHFAVKKPTITRFSLSFQLELVNISLPVNKPSKYDRFFRVFHKAMNLQLPLLVDFVMDLSKGRISLRNGLEMD